MPLSQEDKKKYKSLYLQTAREYVLEFQKNIALLKKGDSSPEVKETLHRAAHSLNSQSMMMSYESMSGVAAQLEKLFEEKRETFSESALQVLSEVVKNMEICLDQIDKEDRETDLTEDIENIRNIA
jgi:chemotaxis protein histidine kinase CheA